MYLWPINSLKAHKMNINDVWKLGRLHGEFSAAIAILDTLNISGSLVLSHDEIVQVRATRKTLVSALDRVASKMDEAESEFSDLMKITKQPA